MEKVIVKPGQSLFDIALQTLGDVEAGLENLAAHNGLEYTDALTPGTELEYDLNWISDLRVVNFYKVTRNGEMPATAAAPPGSDLDLSGVGYDAIEDDLIVYEP
jgi:hypothetical protein